MSRFRAKRSRASSPNRCKYCHKLTKRSGCCMKCHLTMEKVAPKKKTEENEGICSTLSCARSKSTGRRLGVIKSSLLKKKQHEEYWIKTAKSQVNGRKENPLYRSLDSLKTEDGSGKSEPHYLSSTISSLSSRPREEKEVTNGSSPEKKRMTSSCIKTKNRNVPTTKRFKKKNIRSKEEENRKKLGEAMRMKNLYCDRLRKEKNKNSKLELVLDRNREELEKERSRASKFEVLVRKSRCELSDYKEKIDRLEEENMILVDKFEYANMKMKTAKNEEERVKNILEAVGTVDVLEMKNKLLEKEKEIQEFRNRINSKERDVHNLHSNQTNLENLLKEQKQDLENQKKELTFQNKKIIGLTSEKEIAVKKLKVVEKLVQEATEETKRVQLKERKETDRIRSKYLKQISDFDKNFKNEQLKWERKFSREEGEKKILEEQVKKNERKIGMNDKKLENQEKKFESIRTNLNSMIKKKDKEIHRLKNSNRDREQSLQKDHYRNTELIRKKYEREIRKIKSEQNERIKSLELKSSKDLQNIKDQILDGTSSSVESIQQSYNKLHLTHKKNFEEEKKRMNESNLMEIRTLKEEIKHLESCSVTLKECLSKSQETIIQTIRTCKVDIQKVRTERDDKVTEIMEKADIDVKKERDRHLDKIRELNERINELIEEKQIEVKKERDHYQNEIQQQEGVHEEQIEELNRKIEELEKKNRDEMSHYEMKMSELEKKHKNELEELENMRKRDLEIELEKQNQMHLELRTKYDNKFNTTQENFIEAMKNVNESYEKMHESMTNRLRNEQEERMRVMRDEVHKKRNELEDEHNKKTFQKNEEILNLQEELEKMNTDYKRVLKEREYYEGKFRDERREYYSMQEKMEESKKELKIKNEQKNQEYINRDDEQRVTIGSLKDELRTTKEELDQMKEELRILKHQFTNKNVHWKLNKQMGSLIEEVKVFTHKIENSFHEMDSQEIPNAQFKLKTISCCNVERNRRRKKEDLKHIPLNENVQFTIEFSHLTVIGRDDLLINGFEEEFRRRKLMISINSSRRNKQINYSIDHSNKRNRDIVCINKFQECGDYILELSMNGFETIRQELKVEKVIDPKHSKMKLVRNPESNISSSLLFKNDEKEPIRIFKQKGIVSDGQSILVNEPLLVLVYLRDLKKEIIKEKEVRVMVEHSKGWKKEFRYKDWNEEHGCYCVNLIRSFPETGEYSIFVIGTELRASLSVVKKKQIKFCSEDEELKTNLPCLFADKCNEEKIMGDFYDTKKNMKKGDVPDVVFMLSQINDENDEKKSDDVKSGIIVRKKGVSEGNSSNEEVFFVTNCDGKIVTEGEETYVEKMNRLVRMMTRDDLKE